jgi:hypothetical protein
VQREVREVVQWFDLAVGCLVVAGQGEGMLWWPREAGRHCARVTRVARGGRAWLGLGWWDGGGTAVTAKLPWMAMAVASMEE